MTGTPCPKPVRAPKKAPKYIQRKARLQARHWGVSRGPSKTKHGRREREMGFMHFCHSRGCELALDVEAQQILGIVHRCHPGDRLEFAHLSDLKRLDLGDVGAVLCKGAHKGIDGKVGGKAPEYVALGRAGQRTIRMRLANLARAAWDALTDAERAHWNETAAARKGK